MLAEHSYAILWMTLGHCFGDSREAIKMLKKLCYGNGSELFQLATIYRKILKTKYFLFLFLGKLGPIPLNEHQSAKIFTCF